MSQARCNLCVLIILLSNWYNVCACHLSGTTCVLVVVQYTACIRYNVCACHSQIYHYIIFTVVYLVYRGSIRMLVERAV